MKVYLAGPLFSDAERAFNDKLTREIEALGFEVYLPQRDGPENNEKYTLPRYQKAIYVEDKKAVYGCNIFLIVLDGRVPDEGACIELGLAAAHDEVGDSSLRRIFLGLKTDHRMTFPEVDVNPMIGGPLDRIFFSVEDLISHLRLL